MHVVTLLHEPVHGASHRYYVVVGMRREHYHALWIRVGTLRTVGVVSVGLASGPSGDGVLKVVENLYVGVVCRAEEREKLAQSVLVVVFVGEFEDRLARHTAQPHQCRAYKLIGPLAVCHKPRVYYTCELCGCGEVSHHLRVVVCLQERCRDGVGDVPLHSFLYYVRLVVAPRREEYLSCRKDGAHSHCYRAGRHRLLRAEAEGHLLTRRRVDKYYARCGRECASRLVCGYVAHTSHSQEHYVHAALVPDKLLVVAAVLLHLVLRYGSVGREYVFRTYVHMVKKISAQLPQTAVHAVRTQREILVGVEHRHVGKAQPAFLMTPHQLRIHRGERLPRAQTEHTVASFRLAAFHFSLHGVGNERHAFL